MTQKRDLSEVAAGATQDELDRALLDITADLDKAQVLRKTVPHWLVEADASTLTALEQTHIDSKVIRENVRYLLSRLEPLDQYCAERLTNFLRAKGVESPDVRRDLLELPRRKLTGVSPDLGGGLLQTVTYTKQSLLHAAMQNFSAERAEPGGMSVAAVVRSAATRQPMVGMTVPEFVGHCRELDLGALYQKHIEEVFDLPDPKSKEEVSSYNQVAVSIGLGKLMDMRMDLHIALCKGHIEAGTYARLLKLIGFDRPASELRSRLPGNGLINWQGLNIDGTCVWSVLVFSDSAPGSLDTGPFIVYMPNEPSRPWYEYPTLEDFKVYLSLKLQIKSYRTFFEGYVDEGNRLDFFDSFDMTRKVGQLRALPVTTSLTGFFFQAFVGKIQLDALVLAVPKAQVDQQASEERMQRYLDLGLDLLNVASLVVPVLGQLMLGVAVGQLLGEVFEAVEDWQHDEHTEALKHLVNVAENIAAMALFVAGGRVVGTLKRTLTTSAQFFEKFEAVNTADQGQKLWRPRLNAYRQPEPVALQAVASSRGVYQVNGRSYIRMGGNHYSVAFDTRLQKWRVIHPRRPQAYRPPLEHNFRGGWQHVYERPLQWEDPVYSLRRLDPSLDELPAEPLSNLATLTGMTLPHLQALGSAYEPLPERFHDAVLRYKQNDRVRELMEYLERGERPDASTARAQLFALPLVPGWPQGRFFEVLDEEGELLERHPETAPFDYEDLSIHITRKELRDGRVMDTLLEHLSDEERGDLLGKGVAEDDMRSTLERRLLDTLRSRHQAVFDHLYTYYAGVALNELVPLCERFKQLPPRMAWELYSQATLWERRYLRTTGQVPLVLAQRARETVNLLEQDRALMGLYWPELAGDGTRRVAVGMLQQMPGWPRDLALQVRRQTLSGEVLAEAGASTAATQRTLVSTPQGYQAFDQKGKALGPVATGADGLYTALFDSLLPRQRIALKLQAENEAADLRGRLRATAVHERDRVARYLWPERGLLDEEPLICTQAARAEAEHFPAALVRKVNKLYPLLSPSQVNDFLRDAGHDHLSRAKAVQAREQEFEALHTALKRWRAEKSVNIVQADPLWDYRLSRHQAAKSIEKCWRRMSTLPDEHARQVPGLLLDDMVIGPLPTLPAQVRFDHVEHLSLRRLNLTDDVAYFLSHFKGLRTLELGENQMTRLPEALLHMPGLERLYLSNNKLQLTEYTRAKLADLTRLKVLNLADNPLLDPPDISRMFALRSLVLRNCRLKELPRDLWRLPYLEHINLRANDISVLPEWLLRVPRNVAQGVNLRHNPLSAQSQLALKNYRQAYGPGMGFLEDDIARLNEQSARELWLADERMAGYAAKKLTWTSLKDDHRSDALFKLLAELGGTKDAEFVREDLQRRVWRVLEAAAMNSELREEVFDRAATPINCDDAAAVNFSSLEVLVEISDAKALIQGRALTPKPLLKLGRGLFRLEQLEAIARRHSGLHPAADPLEVSLAFRTGLVGEFYLPGQPRHMRYSRLGEVTQLALDEAKAEVTLAELSPELMTYLKKLPFWTDYLKRAHAARFEALNTPYDERLNDIFEQSLVLSDADYRSRMHTVLSEREQAESVLIERLTEDAIRTEGLGPVCEAPAG
ncbi:hypothetical protein cym2001_44100 [Pseudomonas sp. CYM-20-01]|uniref:NEL-type E3 ubiquitin ligase domain-containing protein n=1 Tax=Pseudomonas sp. CYM-20-01 TaxID=2870750 RepID=UPI0020548BD2|nr:NEL-type E3 ubiquitin ligase domain-containing protein [Pseudomonas sp. CYM-20-01]BDB21045.1 hypothetical protein cym2001_44100 [Pseudomonas sp. CYM-20-01]